MKIVVIGGTGLIGSKVVAKLAAQGHEAVAAAPNTGVDTISGAGLAEALAGAEVVVDVSNSPSLDGAAAKAFFSTSGRNVTAAEVAAGVGHHVALSVVGTEKMLESGYFQAKLDQEQQIAGSPVPWTLVRATQFYEFLRGIAQSGTRDDGVHLPHVPFQPMAADDVAAAVAAAALAAPANATIEVAGPEPFYLDELVGKVLAYDKDPRQVIADPDAPYFEVHVTDGVLLPGSGAKHASTRFDWWLTHVPPPPPRK